MFGLANAALSLLKNPSAQDLMFQNQAVAVGLNETRFILEAEGLQYFTVAASINTRRLGGGIKPEQASSLMEAMVRSHYHKFHNELPVSLEMDFLALGLDIDEAFDFIIQRSDEYAKPENFVAAHKQIPRLFARLCGVPDPNDVLQRIGWSLFVIRGSMYVDILKKLRII
jgi:hypothetical protein